MRRIKKVKIVKKPDICIGDHFIYKDIKWICLDIIDRQHQRLQCLLRLRSRPGVFVFV